MERFSFGCGEGIYLGLWIGVSFGWFVEERLHWLGCGGVPGLVVGFSFGWFEEERIHLLGWGVPGLVVGV